jgi:hypothetical protein
VLAPVTRTVFPAKEWVGSLGGFLTAQREKPFVAAAGGSGPRREERGGSDMVARVALV